LRKKGVFGMALFQKNLGRKGKTTSGRLRWFRIWEGKFSCRKGKKANSSPGGGEGKRELEITGWGVVDGSHRKVVWHQTWGKAMKAT